MFPPPEIDLTLLILCYNDARTLESMVIEWSNALRQTLPRFEILILNDGSTDGCGRIADRLRRDIPGVRVVHQLQHGPEGAFRRGSEHARGQYIFQISAVGEITPAEFSEIWSHRNESKLILAQRTRRLDPLIDQWSDAVLSQVIQWFFGVKISDPLTPLRLIHRSVLGELGKTPASPNWDLLAVLRVLSEGAAPKLIPVPYRVPSQNYRKRGVFTRLAATTLRLSQVGNCLWSRSLHVALPRQRTA